MTMLEVHALTPCPPHDSARDHVAGKTTYIDDRPPHPNELHVGLVFSPHAKATIVDIDLDEAKRVPGVACVLTARDLHHNRWGSIFADQPLIADVEVNFVGEVIAVIGATSLAALNRARDCVRVTYETQSAVLSISDALEQQSFIGGEKRISRGDALPHLANAQHRLQGFIDIKGADHFYLENQAAIAYPQDGGIIEVFSSTQHPTETQCLIAEALGLPQSSIICAAPRLGGGFGGKETQAAPFAVYAAMVTHKTGRAARLVLSKDHDMIMTGKRNPYQVHYDVGFSEDGLVEALVCKFIGDGGAYADLSTAILERAMAHIDNAYFLPHVDIRGVVCRTNFHPHTAFRGFGGPKGVAVIEHIMEEIGHTLEKDALDIRKINCYQRERNTTPYGQVVNNNLLPELFSTLEVRADYRARREKLKLWNQQPKNNPRGMSLTAIKFGISFTTRFLNQGNALVHIFRDGSVSVATGAVEMGQGVQARIKSVVAHGLGVNESRVSMHKTATDKNANTSPTAASSGTDLNGTAALIACNTLKMRLGKVAEKLLRTPKEKWPQVTAPFGVGVEFDADKAKEVSADFVDGNILIDNEKIPLVDVINAAYLSRISLSAYGFYKVPHLDFNKLTGGGNAFLYFTQGVACSEVEIDRVTGEVTVLASDILMDLGNPINQTLDRGQISGGFIQGVGWITTEKLFYHHDGALLSHAPSTYKIPSIHDIPRRFSIDLVKNPHNTVNLVGTKAAGEPPLMLCFSVWNAIKDALVQSGGIKRSLPRLPIPSTAEVVLHEMLGVKATTLVDKKILDFV